MKRILLILAMVLGGCDRAPSLPTQGSVVVQPTTAQHPIRIKRVPGEVESISPYGVRLMSFSVKITNTGTSPITMGEFEIQAIDSDGDVISTIEYEAAQYANGVYRLEHGTLQPGESVVKRPSLHIQDYERMSSVQLILHDANSP